MQTTYKGFYENSHYVEIADVNSFPRISDVNKTNNCKISLHEIKAKASDEINLVIFSLIDNLIKGASGQAIQNMNVMCDFPEETGLESAPVLP